MDAGDDTEYSGGYDQRGQPIADSDCDGISQHDIGAYEANFNFSGANNPPPTIVSATADGHSGKITITFSGPVDAATVTTPGNYNFSGGPVVTVNNAAYGVNKRIVLLDISGFADQTIYTLTIGSVQNRAAMPARPRPNHPGLPQRNSRAGLRGRGSVERLLVHCRHRRAARQLESAS